MAELKDFNFKHWWALLATSGIAIAVASISFKFAPGFLCGLGLIFFGVGEFANHPEQMTKVTVEARSGFKVPPRHPWKPNGFGLMFDAIGMGLFGFGLSLWR